MAVDSHAATSLAKAMGHSLLASLAHCPEGRPTGDAMDPQCIKSSILGLANDIQDILGVALAEATTMFPHKTHATPVNAHSPDISGPNRFVPISPTSGAGPRPSAASSNTRQNHRWAFKMSHPQMTPLYQYGLASLRN